MQNRLLYHTIKRLLQGLAFLAMVSVGLVLMALAVSLSNAYLGNPWPAMVLFTVLLFSAMAHILAREDVKLEEIRNRRVLEQLNRD